jgi:hypothetical protein
MFSAAARYFMSHVVAAVSMTSLFDGGDTVNVAARSAV